MWPLKHLQETKQHYVPHFSFAFKAGIKMIVGGISSIIHAVAPDVFPFVAERITKQLSELSNQRRQMRDQDNSSKYIESGIASGICLVGFIITLLIFIFV